MKILFLTDNFFPEVNAPANRTYEHCLEWVRQGVDVTVVTTAPNFPNGKVFKNYSNKLIFKENIEGIKVIRVWSYISANEGTVKRILDYVSFAHSAFWVSLFIKTDVIIATSPQFFTAISGRLISLFRRKPWVMEVRDIWPESIVAVGAITNKYIIRFLEWIELGLYQSANKIIVVTDSFKEIISQKGVEYDKIEIVKNGVNLQLFEARKKDEQIINELGLEGKCVIAYIGTHGMAHSLDFILHCIPRINNTSVHFLFIGDGAEKSKLIELKNKLGLKNVSMLDTVPKHEIVNYLSVVDISLVCLKKSDTFKSVIPSKIFENAAMNKAILLGVEGESADIINSYHAGICFEPENEISFVNSLNEIIRLNTTKEFEHGCKNLATDFDRKNLALKMLDIIKEAV